MAKLDYGSQQAVSGKWAWDENVSDEVGGEGGKEERQPANISAVAPLVKEAFPLVSACSYPSPSSLFIPQIKLQSKDTR